MRRLLFALLTTLPTLPGCDMLGIESASAVAARREAEGKAIGGACRHAARSIEQCYASNRKSDKAAIFIGWREMNDYMRENKIEAMPTSEPPASSAAAEDGEGTGDAAAPAAPKKAAAKADATGKDALAKATAAKAPH